MRKTLTSNVFVHTLLFTFLLTLTACEKVETGSEGKDSTTTEISSDDIDNNKDDDEDKGDDTGTNDNGGTGEDNNDEGGTQEPDNTGYHTGDIVSVSEFLKKDIRCQVWVVGRIVGDCTRNKKYAEFDAPFTHSQAVLIADRPNEKDIEKTVAICLTTNKGMRNTLNLADNSENYNQYVAVFGFRVSYLGI